ncbi:MAG: GNAT family N-acetyltransferase [Micromonosporaceae bacterium]|jgi:GNAT superfamily N-acetyltransferase|nr:GNAT family N-acetyltransferase [Micromonosporaceae bacterium]
MTIEVRVVDADRWDDLAALFGPSGAYSGCWCMWWRVPGSEFRANGNVGNRAALQGLVASGQPVGLLAYEDGEPVGWCAVAPRLAYRRILRSPTLKPDPTDDASVWSVPCFFVKRGHRGAGVAGALLAAAVRYATEQGATTVEGYPVDTTAGRLSAAELYTGTVGLFSRFAFTVHKRPASGRRVVMRRDVHGSRHAHPPAGTPAGIS